MILSMIEHYSDGNKARFASVLGITPQGLSTWIKRETFDTELIFSKCEGISPEWLLTGNGEMLKHTDPAPSSPRKKESSDRKKASISAGSIENDIVSPLMELIRDKDNIIREQAEEIGHLKARIDELERHRGDYASDVASEIAVAE